MPAEKNTRESKTKRRLRYVRAGLSNNEIAELEGVSSQAMSKWRSNHGFWPDEWRNTYDVSKRPQSERELLRMFFTDLIKVVDTLRQGQNVDIIQFMKVWSKEHAKVRRIDW